MVINQNDRTLLNNQLINNNGRYEIDFDNFEELAKEAKMFILCNPHNPVGRIWDEEELQKLITICQENDVIIVSDEIHADIRRVGQSFTPIQTLTESEEVITCTAINKAFNTAGLHCSNIIINNKKYRKKFIKEMGMVSPSPFAIPVLKAAYNESEDWLKQMNEYLDENFLFVKNFLNTHLPKVTFKVAEGTYLGWMDFNAFEMTKEELEEKFIKEANVLIEHGEMFGEDEGKGFVRINLSTPRSVLLEAMKRIEKVFRGL
jgi:cystathionine beta-lyase